MAVFTPVERGQLELWLENYDLGKVVAFEGIHSGIENTNFFLTTDGGSAAPSGRHEFVLTLFERLTAQQLPFYLELMRHLAEHGVPCPAPIPTRGGALLDELNGKPAAIVTRLAGRSVAHATAAHCAAIGAVLAGLHLAGRDFAMVQPNLRGLEWWQETAPEVLPYLDADCCVLLESEVAYQVEVLHRLRPRLPAGPIHADVFRDNVLFVGPPDAPRIGGVIDFYFAGFDAWLFDVAVCVNDWCIDPATGELDSGRTEAFLNAYAATRPFTGAECDAWHAMLRAAALRFWLSRLWDFHLPRPAAMLTPHDPTHFERILRRRRAADKNRALSGCTLPSPDQAQA